FLYSLLVSFSSPPRRPPPCPLLPYPTLFRSTATGTCPAGSASTAQDHSPPTATTAAAAESTAQVPVHCLPCSPAGAASDIDHVRSEEHTSELQSRENLVCRLLLEKKNIINTG